MKLALRVAFMFCVGSLGISVSNAQVDTTEGGRPQRVTPLYTPIFGSAARQGIFADEEALDSLLKASPQLREAVLRYLVIKTYRRSYGELIGDSAVNHRNLQMKLSPFEWMSLAGKRREEYFGHTPTYGMMGQLSIRGLLKWINELTQRSRP